MSAMTQPPTLVLAFSVALREDPGCLVPPIREWEIALDSITPNAQGASDSPVSVKSTESVVLLTLLSLLA